MAKAKKYAKLRGNIKPFVEDDAAWQEKVEKEKEKILGGVSDASNANVTKLSADYCKTRDKKDDLDDKLSAVNITIEAYAQIISEILQDQELESIALSNGDSVGLSDDIIPRVTDKRKLYEYLGKIYGKDLIYMLTLNHGTLKTMTKTQLEQAKPYLPGTDVFLRTTIKRMKKGANNGETK